ncbi:protein rep [Flavilitoribacter nigricans]|uniref:Uncharacterized protein n=1 Tax=Flavilitoribacter nigricans (strain ATCC 23147 / DSM 23189 / NBRC 102662 / NCIMB 1420 / SS-2) TaxID=1122177 RepID=A0A2D0NBW8_FLAN2|nr:protein rep [Flavilitoribacter nigricans]PHN05868.1 hypothetical protein CRP01_15490 [Flavilitoribacter nigricans DSM 23189 = NBRC 102662]
MYTNSPFLDSKETVGMMATEPTIGFTGNFDPQGAPGESAPPHRQRANYNRRRCLAMRRQLGQNQRNYTDLHEWLEKKRQQGQTVIGPGFEYLMDFRYKINTCCHHALFREHLNSDTKEFIGAHTCKHKLCAVCNAQRAKKVRRTWWNFFEEYPDLIRQYDFMHLTLTVPHDATNSFRGQRWYADELMKEFNYMRKKAFWKKMVYAGEFGVEVTKNQNGLHIHIHALLLVHKSLQNRNSLHRQILLAWNMQTAGSGQRNEITAAEKASILKSNCLLTPEDVNCLSPDGATLIGLESLYLRSDQEKRGYRYDERSGYWKRYVRPEDGFDTFLGGIMECIKYHFQPMAMYEDGTLDFELITEILPAIKGKPLYRKFGAFHAGTKNAHPGAKTLNVNYKPDESGVELAEDLANLGHEEVIDPESGEPVLREEYRYLVVSLAKVRVDPNDDLRIKICKNVAPKYLDNAYTAFDALVEMDMMARARQRAVKNKFIKPKKAKSCLKLKSSETSVLTP